MVRGNTGRGVRPSASGPKRRQARQVRNREAPVGVGVQCREHAVDERVPERGLARLQLAPVEQRGAALVEREEAVAVQVEPAQEARRLAAREPVAGAPHARRELAYAHAPRAAARQLGEEHDNALLVRRRQHARELVERGLLEAVERAVELQPLHQRAVQQRPRQRWGARNAHGREPRRLGRHVLAPRRRVPVDRLEPDALVQQRAACLPFALLEREATREQAEEDHAAAPHVGWEPEGRAAKVRQLERRALLRVGEQKVLELEVAVQDAQQVALPHDVQDVGHVQRHERLGCRRALVQPLRCVAAYAVLHHEVHVLVVLVSAEEVHDVERPAEQRHHPALLLQRAKVLEVHHALLRHDLHAQVQLVRRERAERRHEPPPLFAHAAEAHSDIHCRVLQARVREEVASERRRTAGREPAAAVVGSRCRRRRHHAPPHARFKVENPSESVATVSCLGLRVNHVKDHY
ncbi:hypothetical protein PybrP1_011795 [[Pythium] brassicae (nom. inval.)]|nr:hypothetical protein PybrP1_011795 [[Pythium] brassicae (nom. inval.)]